MSDGKSHDFIVRLEGLQLSSEHQHRIASAIQSVVMAELGKVDLAPKGAAPQGNVNLALLPLKWRGIWYRTGLPANIGELVKSLTVEEG